MTSTAEVAPEEKMNAAAVSSWQLHHFSDLWGVIKKNVHVCHLRIHAWSVAARVFPSHRSLLLLVSAPAAELGPDHLHGCESTSALRLHLSQLLPGRGLPPPPHPPSLKGVKLKRVTPLNSNV